MATDGPDRIIPTENYVTTKPDGCVKIRETNSENLEPMSLVTYTKNQVRSCMLWKKLNLDVALPNLKDIILNLVNHPIKN